MVDRLAHLQAIDIGELVISEQWLNDINEKAKAGPDWIGQLESLIGLAAAIAPLAGPYGAVGAAAAPLLVRFLEGFKSGDTTQLGEDYWSQVRDVVTQIRNAKEQQNG